MAHVQRLAKPVIHDLEKINEIQNIDLLLELLKERVGSLLVVANLAADLQVAPNTVKRWITILEKMYLVFCVRPYTNKLSRSISKPFKIYFYDNTDVIGDEGAKYENLVATHLLKKFNLKKIPKGTDTNCTLYVTKRVAKSISSLPKIANLFI